MRSAIGVFVGGLVDILATAILSLPLIVLALVNANGQGLSPEKQTTWLTTYNHGHPAIYAIGFFLGCVGSAIGGYVAGWIAKRQFVFIGALSAWLCVVSGVSTLADPNISSLEHIAGFLCGPIFGALGGYVRGRVVSVASP